MKKIKGASNYSITNDGKVINTRTGRVLKYVTNQNGYKMVQININGRLSTKTIHRLVYETFNSKIPKDLQINHIDGDKSNNNISNLETVTHKENMQKAVDIGLIKTGFNCKLSKAVAQIDVMTGDVINEFGSLRIAYKETGITESSISNVCNKNRITAGGYKWKFV